MPELPEVETVRRVLKNSVLNLTITDIKIKYENIISDDVNEFKNNIIGKKIIDIERLGKYLIFKLNDGNIVSHLRMEGKYFYLEKDSIDNKHIHVIYYFDNGFMLAYQDVRKFGRMAYRTNQDLYTTKPLCEVGIDPILNKQFDIVKIYDTIVSRSVAIKTTLLDQSIIAGLGNIYVDEVLFESKINPNRPSNTISVDEVKRIIDSLIEILSKAIEFKGTTIRSYTSSLGVEGEFQKFLKVHTKKVCPHCQKALIRVKINGRTTYFCEVCQR